MLLHQEFVWLAGHAHGAVVVNQVVPAIVRAQPVNCGEIDAGLPLLRRDPGGPRGRDLGVLVHGLSSPLVICNCSIARWRGSAPSMTRTRLCVPGAAQR